MHAKIAVVLGLVPGGGPSLPTAMLEHGPVLSILLVLMIFNTMKNWLG